MARPRDVSSDGSYWLDHEDGTVERVIIRRTERSMGTWAEFRFRGATVADVEAQVDRWALERVEKLNEQTRRRARWGIQV